MTFFHVEEGWLVLSTIEDLCTKEIIAWGGGYWRYQGAG